MKTIIAALICLGGLATVQAQTFTQQQAASNAAGATSLSTPSMTVTAGHSLIVEETCHDTLKLAVPTDVQGDVFVQVGSTLNIGNWYRAAYYLKTAIGGATVVTYTPSTACAGESGLYVADFTSMGAVLNATQNVQNPPGGGTDAITSAVANATVQPALVFGFSYEIDNGGGFTSVAVHGTGFTGLTPVWSGLYGAIAAGVPEYKIVSVTGNVAATFTSTADGTYNAFFSDVVIVNSTAATVASSKMFLAQ